MPNIMLLFLLPLILSVIIFALPFLPNKWLQRLAFLLSLSPLILLLSGGYSWIGTTVNYPWLSTLSINFHLSIDTLSLIFLFLTAIVTPISLLAVNANKLENPNIFYGLILLLQSLLIGFFTARDIVAFTLFWEAMLIPLYLLINMWGGPHRHGAAIKFLIYMIAGSILMVAAVLALYFASASTGAATFNIDLLQKSAESMPYAWLVWSIFILAFAVKTPLFPFHAWLPDAYCQASTAGTILLAGILSKAGIYGIFRIGLGLFPNLMQAWSPVLLSLAIAGVLYGSMTAWMQKDFKRLIAYSSLAHVNFILAGVFIWNVTAHEGALLQAVNHGITITGLFLVSGWLETRLGTTAIGPYSGLAKFFPHLCWLSLFFVLSSVGLPGLNNFIGELMILFGLFSTYSWLAALLGASIILSVIYMLRWMQKIYFEAPSPYQNSWIDITGKEIAIALPLVALILWIGIYPTLILEQISNTKTSINPIAVNNEVRS